MHVKLGDIDVIWLFSLGIGFIINGCMKLIYCIDSTFIPGISHYAVRSTMVSIQCFR